VVTQNNAGPTYWVGRQEAGGQFEAYWDKVGAVGHYDYGSLTMARTLGSDPNQVAKNGRRVLVGWIGGTPASQSLARDLSLSADFELLQAFVPELQMLRQPSTYTETIVTAESTATIVPHAAGSLQMEVLATFSWTGAPPSADFGFTVLGGTAKISVSCAASNVDAPCMVTSPSKGPVLPISSMSITVHTIVDHEIVETIANNRTAMVTYHKNIPSAGSTDVALFGTTSGIHAVIKTWNLDAANNAGPQPL
jgi:sucrose-6-phosphate hydrolase SacC (GH32 family)